MSTDGVGPRSGDTPPHPPTPQITFALVQPSEPENIGAAARSLGAFGFERLVVIAPTRRQRSRERSLAVRGGRRVLHDAHTVSLEESDALLAEHAEIWGTSARQGRRRRNSGASLAVADYLRRRPGKLLMLFGTERDGLSLDWLDRCHRVVQLPTPGGPLNLAHAVTVMAYELRLQLGEPRSWTEPPIPSPDGNREMRAPRKEPLASPLERRELLRRTESVLLRIGYPTRALRGHPPQAYLEPLRSGALSVGQARWLMGLLTHLERQLRDPGGAVQPPG